MNEPVASSWYNEINWSPDEKITESEIKEFHFGYLTDQVCNVITLSKLAALTPGEPVDVYRDIAKSLLDDLLRLKDEGCVPPELYLDPKASLQLKPDAFKHLYDNTALLVSRSDYLAKDQGHCADDMFAVGCRQIAANVRHWLRIFMPDAYPMDDIMQEKPPSMFSPAAAFRLTRWARRVLKLNDDFHRFRRLFAGTMSEAALDRLEGALYRIDIRFNEPINFIRLMKEWSYLDSGVRFPRNGNPAAWMRVLHRMRDQISFFHEYTSHVYDTTLAYRFPSSSMLGNQGVGYLFDLQMMMAFCRDCIDWGICPSLTGTALETWHGHFANAVESLAAVNAQFDVNLVGLPGQIDKAAVYQLIPLYDGQNSVAEQLSRLAASPGLPEGLKTAMLGFSTNIKAYCAALGAPLSAKGTDATLYYPNGLLFTPSQRAVVDLGLDLRRVRRHIRPGDEHARNEITTALAHLINMTTSIFAHVPDNYFRQLLEPCYRHVTTGSALTNINAHPELHMYYSLCLSHLAFLMNRFDPHGLFPNQYPSL